MNNDRIPLHEPEFDLSDGMALTETLRSTWVSTGGPFVERFEREFAQFVGKRHAISVCNGTIAIQLMLECVKLQANIEGPFDVLVPTLTFMATGAAVVHAGGRPVFIDCSATQLNIDLVGVESHIRQLYRWDATRELWLERDSGRPLLAVMAAHIMGWPGAARELSELCANLKVPYLEDAAESLGTFLGDGLHAGAHSMAAAFSFNGNKILTTGGGGMIVTDSEKLAKLAKHLSTTAKINGLRYEHDMIGHNFRMVNILAALGCSQLEKLKDRLLRKKAIFSRYEKNLAAFPDASLYSEDGVQGNHWLINLVFKNESDRESVLLRLNEQGIEARPLWTPLHLQPAFRGHAQFNWEFPNAVSFWKKTLSLPSSPGLKESHLARVCQVIQNLH